MLRILRIISRRCLYTVIPLRAGELALQVTAVSRSFTGRDAIRKTLRVVVSLHVVETVAAMAYYVLCLVDIVRIVSYISQVEACTWFMCVFHLL